MYIYIHLHTYFCGFFFGFCVDFQVKDYIYQQMKFSALLPPQLGHVGPGHGASAGLRLGHGHAGRREPTEFHAPVAQLQTLGKSHGISHERCRLPSKNGDLP